MRSIVWLIIAVVVVAFIFPACSSKNKDVTFNPGDPWTPPVPPAADTTAPIIAGGIQTSQLTAGAGDLVSLSVVATDNSSTALTYAWDDGGAGGEFTGSGARTKYSNATQGTYTITVTVTDAAGNVTTATIDITIGAGGGGGYFDTLPGSLHGTANGMRWWYEQPDGFGTLTDVAYNDTGCNLCHVFATGEGAMGTANGCSSCHAEDFSVDVPGACLRCHSRQGTEINSFTLPDVHRDGTHFEGSCIGCHSLDEIHGDGNSYDSMHSAGQFKVDCINCHTGEYAPDPAIPEHARHLDVMHCDSCHVSTTITCYNCHFDSLMNDHQKKPYKAFSGFVFLANDAQDGKIRTATYQSVVYGEHTFVAFGPYHGHAITAAGRTCNDCHGNDYVTEYRDTGKIVLTEWDAAANGGAGDITHAQGVIPFIDPANYVLQYLGFDGTNWTPSTTTSEGTQYKFIEPLTDNQLNALSMDFGAAYANLPTSLHGTSNGMRWWFEQTDGLGTLASLDFDTVGCNTCHVYSTGEGAMGTETGCTTCHAEDFSVDMPTTCYRCHSGLELEATEFGYTDLHMESASLDKCFTCHEFEGIHGDGTQYDSMHSEGQFKNDCIDCHTGAMAPPSNPEHNMHLGTVHCDSCHMQSTVTCYNCHMESLASDKTRRSYKALNGFIMLGYDPVKQRVRPVSYQSVVYGTNQFVVFGPYHSHTITAVGRNCAECHGDGFTGNANMTELNTTGRLAVTKWDPAANGGAGDIVQMQGIIPFAPDFFDFAFMNYDSGTDTWTQSGVTQFDYQYKFIEPLSTDQLDALGYTGAG
jgi:hypothetical protein